MYFMGSYWTRSSEMFMVHVGVCDKNACWLTNGGGVLAEHFRGNGYSNGSHILTNF